jgi:hypothetical protein
MSKATDGASRIKLSMRFMALPRYAMSLDANSIIGALPDRHSLPHKGGGKQRGDGPSVTTPILGLAQGPAIDPVARRQHQIG